MASMGYGKTTTVRSFLDKYENVQTIWFSPSMNKHDGVWLWRKICKNIGFINKNLEDQLITFGFPKNRDEIYKIIDLINNFLEEDTVIILDDWQEIKNKQIINFIEEIILEKIPKLHVVIISRNMLPDKYLEYEIKNQCTIIWQEDLAFTIDETSEFYRINGFELNDKEKKDLYDYTSGWIVPTYLSLIEYSKNKETKNIPKATKLIKNAVCEKLDEDEKMILLKLSLLDNFTLKQAFYITQNRDVGRLIRNLYENNCFLKYHPDTDTYFFHSILKQALRQETEKINMNLEPIYNNCAEWYIQNKDIGIALGYYLKAKNYDKILKIVESIWMTEDFDLESEFISLILRNVKEEHKINNPIGFLIVLYNCLANVDQTYGKELLQETKKLYEIQVDIKNKEHLLGEIMLIENYFCNNTEMRFKNLKKVYYYFNGRKSYILSSETPFSLRNENSIQFYHRKKGELKEAVKLLGENICYFINTSNGGSFGLEYLVKAEFEYEVGNMEKAELLAYKSLYKAKSKKQTSILIDAYSLIMRIEINKGNIDEVTKLINMLEQEIRYIKLPILITRGELTIAYIKVLIGIEKDIPSWANEYDVVKHKLISTDYNRLYIVSGIYMILRKCYIELEVLAEIMISENKKNKNIFGQIYAYIFEAIAKYNIYGIERAKISYFKALIISREDNIIMPFVELSPYSRFIINNLNFNNEYLQKLLHMIKNYLEINRKINKDSDISYLSFDLTEREIEVMELICKGYKQIDIGNELHISLNTVRYHSKNIYDKLEVSNKALAIQKYNNEYRIKKQ